MASAPRWISFLLLVAAGSPICAQSLKDLSYNTVTPCVVADTRLAGGALAGSETRLFNVVGAASLASQGGSPTGCGVPGFSSGTPQVQAVALNIVAISPSGPGFLVATAADVSAIVSVINYNTGQTAMDSAPVAVRQGPGTGDIKIIAGGSGTHVLISVVGYYRKLVQTVPVSPVPGNPAASGTALLNALAGITDATAARRYVLRLEPGVYDVGDTMLVLKPFVDIEGSGQQATVIQGAGNSDSSLSTAVVKAADSAELRNLQVKSVGLGRPISAAVVSLGGKPLFTDLTVVADGGATNEGFEIRGASPVFDRVTISVSGGTIAYGIATSGTGAAHRPVIRNSRIHVASASRSHGLASFLGALPEAVERTDNSVSGGSESIAYLVDTFGLVPGFGSRIREARFTAQGAFTNYGIRIRSASDPLLVTGSEILAGGGTSYGAHCISGALLTLERSAVAGGTNSIFWMGPVHSGATRLDGPADIALPTCVASYDGNFAPLNVSCLP